MNPILYLFLLILELITLIAISIYSVGLLYSSLMGAPFVPTSKKRISEIFKKAKLKKGEVFIELGSGDGRLIIYAAKQYQVHAIGIEINPLLVFVSRLYASLAKVHVTFKRENVLSTNLKQANVVYLFLMPNTISKLMIKFNAELKPNTQIISHGFKLPGWDKKLTNTLSGEPFSTYYYHA